MFHTSFLLLLVAVVWGKATGYQGLVRVPEGGSFTEARAGYDQIAEGLLFNGQHAGFTVHLDKFTANYAANGEASDYVSNVTVLDHGRPVEQKAIRVNDFLGYDGINVYLQDYGWAPVLMVKNPAGQTVFDGPVLFSDDQARLGNKGVADGVLKVPDFGYTVPGYHQGLQLGAKMALYPDATVIPVINPDGSVDTTQIAYGPGGPTPRNPIIEMQLFVGDLGLNGGSPQNVDSLNTSSMQPYFSDGHTVALAMGKTVPLNLPGGNGQTVQFSVTFQALHQYSLFQVNKDSGVLLVYATFIASMTGMLTKLYLRPFLERRARRRRRAPLQLDARWTASVSGEPVAAESGSQETSDTGEPAYR